MRFTVTHAGFLTTVQDLGRRGFRRFGVSLGGALDVHALRVANLLVQNDEAAAGLEITFGGLRIRFDDQRIIAWCGGEFDVRIGSTAVPPGHAILVNAGEELSVSQPTLGCRVWVAISGGVDVPHVLESRSTDLRAEFGGIDGRALRVGDVVTLAPESNSSQSIVDLLRERRISAWSPPSSWSTTAMREPILRFIRGPDWSLFNDFTHEAFTTQSFTVSNDSNRMGARLDGPVLWRNEYSDLISEPVAPGTVQVPPSGNPIVLLGDCQTIGGYPKIANVISVDLPIAAQLGPGHCLRFREVTRAEAHRLLFHRERDLGLFRVGLETRAA